MVLVSCWPQRDIGPTILRQLLALMPSDAIAVDFTHDSDTFASDVCSV